MQPDLLEQRVGDKVRIKSGQYSGQRGLISEVEYNHLGISLDATTNIVVESNDITNFSLAARKAWRSMPKKAGRPKSRAAKKMVSIRVDIQVWNALGQAVEQGLITSREEAVNQWLRERLKNLTDKLK